MAKHQVVNVAEAPKRGGCLTAFLIVAMIGNVLLSLFQWLSVQNLYVSDKPHAFLGGTLNAVAVVFAIAVWKWKRWGVYGYIGTIGVSILLNLMVGQILFAVQGLVPIALLIGLLRPVWKDFHTQQSLSSGEQGVILFLEFVMLAAIGVFPVVLINTLKSVSLTVFSLSHLVIFMIVCGTTFLVTRYVSAFPLIWFMPFAAWVMAEVVIMVLLTFSGDVGSVMIGILELLFTSGFGILDNFALPWSASFITWTSGGLIGGLIGFVTKRMRQE